MARPIITNLIKFYAVLLLLEKERHGYELIKEIAHRLGKSVSHGQMYPFLAGLKKSNLVESTKKGNREKTTYKLTKKGKEFAKTMLDRCACLLEIAIKPRLSSCTNCSCKVFEGGATETVHGKRHKFCCHHCAASYRKHMHS